MPTAPEYSCARARLPIGGSTEVARPRWFSDQDHEGFVRRSGNTPSTWGAAKERPRDEGEPLVNTRTIAVVALIIAIIVLLLLLL
jgi:hypothetical protein